MAEKSDEFAEVKELLDSIQQDVAGGEYVYRGTPEVYTWDEYSYDDEKRINSSIFRQYDKNIDFGTYRPARDENEIIKEVRPYFPPHSSNIEILSDLRHFGGDTTLIDFSKDLFVALFFACNGELDKDGELIAFPTAKAETSNDDYFRDNSDKSVSLPKKISLIEPIQTQTNKARVIAQKSVFIHAPEGFILSSLCKIISIKSELKKQILTFLKRFHDIEERTIYPDLHGYIDAQIRFAPSRAHFYAGIVLSKQNKYESAVKKYDEAIRIKPDFTNAYFNRGIAKAHANKPEEAIADFDEAIRLRPDDGEAYNNRGIAKSEANRFEEAIADFDEAIRLKYDYADAYNSRGLAKMHTDKLEEAIADFDEVIRIDSDNAEGYNSRGLAKMHTDKPEEAIADFDEAIRLRPDYVGAYCNRGAIKMESDRFEEAITDFDKAIHIDPNFAQTYCNRGIVKAKSNRLEEAITDFDKAIHIDPNFAQAYYNRGVTWQSLGDEKKAQADFDKAKKIGLKTQKERFITSLLINDP